MVKVNVLCKGENEMSQQSATDMYDPRMWFHERRNICIVIRMNTNQHNKFQPCCQ